MADSALPPLVLELRANASDFISQMGAAKKATSDVADQSGTAATASASNFDRMAGAGKAMAMGIVGAGVTVGGAALKMGLDFQDSMTTLVTGAGESEDNIKNVGNGILDMAGKVGQTSQALAGGMYLIDSAGFKDGDGLKVLQAAAEGAKVGSADMKTVADGLTTTLTDYGLKASDAADVTSKLVTTVASGKTTMGDLAGSLSNVLPTASAAKVGLDQVLGAMATMTGQGISADQASQDLASTMRTLSAPSEEASKAMAQIGINSTDLAANLGTEGLTGTMDDVYTAIMQHMGPSGLVLEDSFNQSKLAAQSANQMIGQLPASLQTLAQGYLAGTVTQTDWMAALKDQPATIANLGKQFATTAKQATGFSDQLKSGSGDAQTFNATLSSVMGGATGMNTALALTGGNMQTFQNNVAAIGSATAASDGSVKGFALTQEDLKTKLENAKDGAQAMITKLGMEMIPAVTSVMDKVTAFGQLLLEHKGLLITVAGVIGGVVVTAILTYVASLVKAQIETVAKLGLMVAGWLGYSAESTAAAAESAAATEASVISQFATMLGAAISGFASMIAAGASWVATTAVQMAEGIASGAAWIAEHVAMAAAAVVQYGIMAAAATAAFIAENAATLGIGLAIAAVVAAIVWCATHWSECWDAIKAAASAVWDFLKPAFSWITGIFFDGIKAYLDVFRAFWGGVWAGAKAVVSDFWGGVKTVWGWIGDGLGAIRSAISAVGGVWGSIWGGIQSAVQSVWSVIKPIFDAITGAVSKVTGAISGISHGIGSVVSSVGHFLSFDNGGLVPGPKGAPQLAVVHGGEYMLSTDMLDGKQQPDGLLDAQSANGYTPTSMSQNALTGGGTQPGSGQSGGQTVVVYAQTNADPNRIAAEAGWALRAMA